MKIAVVLLSCVVALTQYTEGSQPLVLVRSPIYDFATIPAACTHLLRYPSWQIYRGNIHDFFEDSRTKQYLRCYLGQLNVMTPEGRFNPPALIHLLGERYSHQINTCAALTQLITDPFDLAYRLVNCFGEQDPEILPALGLIPPSYYIY